MKKFILPLVLLLAIGMLAAVESDPSAVVGYVKYPCVAGNNMLALPMVDAYTTANELGDAISATTVGYFDTATQLWSTVDAFPWGGWSDDFALSNGQALWIYVESDVDFYSLGALPAVQPTYELVIGNNVVMLPLDKGALNSANLVGDDMGATTVGYFDGTTQLWSTVDAFPWGGWSDDFATSIGAPLWIYTETEGTWPVAAAKVRQNIKTKSK
ncbi:MAG: hypothetical protein CVU50_06680 [Candidatus Cloacimonetes bacterium HGW-Cloacimonetes-3]|jgi:hypothetical protein|nr:MAG: hypothetical protein CVU50_06680 [Candidatus Cloacimonetes bacterium HGW-Cloacimonetes-3]